MPYPKESPIYPIFVANYCVVTGRTAVEDYELGNTGIVIKKGMNVMIPTYAMHYDPDFFEDPETFNPERFMEGYEPKHPQYAYLPFGAGPRNCLGMRFALLEIKMCLANLFRYFRVKPHSTTKIPLEYKKGAILLTVTELPLLVEKRTEV
ncbi:cytochrome P450 3A21 [Trichonephila clavipes]|nr:cytochrome P450 3A21 [Trichonephila clavipes]